MILIIDNYDSFTFNLAQYFLMLGEEAKVVRNDELDTEAVKRLDPKMIVLSPGPGRPSAAGVSLKIVDAYAGRIPIFGICLGMQVFAAHFGAKVVEAESPMHGKVRQIRHDGRRVFAGLKPDLKVTRYHSLVVERESLPACLGVSAESLDGEIMGLRHFELAVEGLQFHPEALLTENGLDMLRNAIESYC